MAVCMPGFENDTVLMKGRKVRHLDNLGLFIEGKVLALDDEVFL